MRRVASFVLTLSVAFAGCAMPVDGAPGDDALASPLRFELERGEDDLVTGVRLVNDGVEELRFGPADMGYSPMPKVLVEAQQEGGEYVGRGEWYAARGDERGAYDSLPPGGVVHFPAGYSALDLRPGDYRVSVDLYGAGDTTQRVSRELSSSSSTRIPTASSPWRAASASPGRRRNCAKRCSRVAPSPRSWRTSCATPHWRRWRICSSR